MKTIQITLGLAALLLAAGLQAQNESDALRYSLLGFDGSGGTAKAYSLGGAVGALGADATAVTVNPAGLARYSRGEFTMSLGLNGTTARSRYIGTQEYREGRFNINIPNVSVILAGKVAGADPQSKEGILNYAFSFNINRQAGFSRRMLFQGINTGSSYTDFLAERCNGSANPDMDFSEGSLQYMAWNSYAVDPKSGTTDQYISSIYEPTTRVEQTVDLTGWGGITTYQFAYGANYGNWLYMGLGIDLPGLRYRNKYLFREKNLSTDTVKDLKSIEYSEDFKDKGSAIGARLGIIALPAKFFRVGLAYQTPMRFNISEDYILGMKTTFDPGTPGRTQSSYSVGYGDPQQYKYNVTMPARTTASAAVFFGKYGFLSADYEMVNYRGARLSAQDGSESFMDENLFMKTNYRNAGNLRLGGELNLGLYRIRAGFNRYGSPWAVGSIPFSKNFYSQSWALGFGIREKTWFFDIGWQYNKRSEYFTPYKVNTPGLTAYSATNNFRRGLFVLTYGVNFE